MTENPNPAIEAARDSGVPFRVVEHGPVASAAEAAAARGVTIAALARTLVVRVDADDHRLVVVPGDRSLAWPKLRALVGVSRLSMADPATLEEVTGFARGTVTPFGSARRWPVIVDLALLAHAEISIGGGRHGVAIQIAPDDLVAVFDAAVGDVTSAA